MVTLATKTLRIDPSTLNLTEKVVHTRRVAKVIKGGRHLRFNALVVVGDGEGTVGSALGKADAIPDAVRKAGAAARKTLIKVPLKGSTLPHEGIGHFGATMVLVKPAPPGTGIIAAGAVRAVMDLAGIRDVVTKTLGSRNPINVVKATLNALQTLHDPAQAIAKRKGTPTPAAERAGRASG